MKKPISILIGLLLLSLLLTYVLIPTVIVIRKSTLVSNNQKGLVRSLSDSTGWKQWWPGLIEGEKLMLDEKVYRVTDHTFSTVMLDIHQKDKTVKSSLNIIALSTDSTKLQLVATMPASYNPYKRMTTYLLARAVSNDFAKILEAAKSYYNNSESIYGLDIRRESVKNPWLIFTTDSSRGYPSTEKIYGMIANLRKYIANNNALAVDSPMLNIDTNDSSLYLTKVAIPTDRKLPSAGNIQYRWMLEGGNILSAEVKGGNQKVNTGLQSVQRYVQDYELVAPAIPFYALLTNRQAQPDSSKWVTKIFYPIMYFK